MEDNKLKNQIGNTTSEDIGIRDANIGWYKPVTNIKTISVDKLKGILDSDILAPLKVPMPNLKDIPLKVDHIAAPSIDKLKSQIDNTIKNIPTTKKRYTLVEMIEKFKENNKLKFKDLDGNVVISLRYFDTALMFEFEKPTDNVSYVTMPIDNCYELIEEPVTFKEVLNSDKRCRIEHELIKKGFKELEELDNDTLSLPPWVDTALNHIKEDEYTCFMWIITGLPWILNGSDLREVIKNGKWYLEE